MTAPRRALRAIAVALALSPLRRREGIIMHVKSYYLLIMFLIALLVAPTMAMTVNETEYLIDDTRYEFDKNIIVDGSDTATDPEFEIFFRNYRDLANIQSVVWKPSAAVRNFVLYDEGIPTESYNVDFKTSPTYGEIIGSGHLTYFKGPSTGHSHVRIDFDNIDTDLMTSNTVYVVINDDKLFNLKKIYGEGTVWPQNYLRTYSVSPLLGTTEIEYTSRFTHLISLDDYTDDSFSIKINRTGSKEGTVDGRKSVVSIYDHHGNLLHTDTGSSNVIKTVDKNLQPYTVVVQSIAYDGKTYTGYLGSGEAWIPPGDPGPDDPADPSRVMVHIIAQDARNENLLLDAAVEVRDQYDAVVAAGTTSPEGWMVFEYDLPDTLTDEDFDRYYTVSVSLPGWTQKVTDFKFWPAFIPRSGDWIRVEMLPDSSGPADPEKTYIMFFVRDIHANPLERASIEIAGQYWHTNSAGHVAVEVPKNSTTAYTVRKTGHVSISGSAAVGAEGSYVVNIALGPALPDRTPGPGDDPGATPPPRDTRTNEEKGKAVIDLIADNAELIATLAILAAVMGLINLIMPGRRRR